MNTLEELIYYCKETDPAGALLLTGEWGCGKTYLIDKVLKQKLAERHILLRVTLFGMSSVEELKNEIKRNWLFLLAEEKFTEENVPLSGVVDKLKAWGGKAHKFVKSGKEFLPEPFKSIADGLLSLNALDFVKIQPKMGEKRVVLVFDDLERANISTGDLLGCINDYCENLHMTTIIVANEGKIKSNEKDKIKYDEIKEKIIQRTIKYTPNFSDIVGDVINDMPDDPEQYKKFILSQKEVISAMFLGNTVDGIPLDEMIPERKSGKSAEDDCKAEKETKDLLKRRPHNIRSLKCALQDFKRVFYLLEEQKIEQKERWLFSYIAYVLCYRAELASESECYGISSEGTVSVLYPGYFNSRYITNGIMHWICTGEWNKEEIKSELKIIIERDRAITPEEKVRTYRLPFLDEQDLQVGYPMLLEKAYNGGISLDDYVHFLWNRCWGREYSIPLPDVEWTKIYAGIESVITKMTSAGVEQPHHRLVIDEKKKAVYLEEEWKAYELIRVFLDNETLIFEKNKKMYMDAFINASSNSLNQVQTKRFDRFDEEMAQATAEGYRSASNALKNQMIHDFRAIWRLALQSQAYKVEGTQNGFSILEEKLSELVVFYEQTKQPIAKFNTNRFLEVVSELKEEYEKKKEKDKGDPSGAES